MSVAASSVAFSVYEEDGYNIYSIDAASHWSPSAETVDLPHDAGVLPPRTSGDGLVFGYLSNPVPGLPSVTAERTYPTEKYRPKLSLDFIGQPAIGVGVDSFGTYVGGGIAASFSDVLGNHTVAGTLQATSRFDE